MTITFLQRSVADIHCSLITVLGCYDYYILTALCSRHTLQSHNGSGVLSFLQRSVADIHCSLITVLGCYDYYILTALCSRHTLQSHNGSGVL